jgi:hypothetical protein
VRFAYVKIAEYQRRGLVHLHVVIRLDRAMAKYRAGELHPPTRPFDVELLERTIRAPARTVSTPIPNELGGGRIRWGGELDVQPIATGRALEPSRCAGYLAKCATKATEQAGGVLHPVTERQVDHLPVRDYLRRAFALDGQLPKPRLARTAHAFGYRGHCLTKRRNDTRRLQQLAAPLLPGQRRARPYDLRHSFVSLLIAEGRTVIDVAGQAGHSPETCLRYYAHLPLSSIPESG